MSNFALYDTQEFDDLLDTEPTPDPEVDVLLWLPVNVTDVPEGPHPDGHMSNQQIG